MSHRPPDWQASPLSPIWDDPAYINGSVWTKRRAAVPRFLLHFVENLAARILFICWLFEPNGGSLLRGRLR